MKNKVMFYCQHILGMGHLVRSMEIVHGLKDFEVCFVSGGEIASGFEFPSSVKFVHLPPINSDEDFKAIKTAGGLHSLAEIKAARIKSLLSEFERFKPELVILELFPFGRKKFAFELIPLLARIRTCGESTKVVCSLRDILVSKRDQKRHEERVCLWMNRYFDMLLIHADPRFQRLEETFSKTDELKSEIKYTGYVVQSSPSNPVKLDEDNIPLEATQEPIILVSIGGGAVGYDLLKCAIEASSAVEEIFPHRMLIFTGPYFPPEQYLQLQEMVSSRPGIFLRQYTSQFLVYMEKAVLSVSMAGYNTCMNILTTGVRALVLPFTGGENNEQTIRATKLEALGIVSVIQPNELQPNGLAEKMLQCINRDPVTSSLDLNGVENTSAFLKDLLKKQDPSAQSKSTLIYKPSKKRGFEVLERDIRPFLEQFQKGDKVINIFFRDDDVDEDDEDLRHLLDIFLSRIVPLNLELIPGKLTDAAIKLLKDYKRFHPNILEFNQHGWQHTNHEQEGRKCEFGFSRSFHQQLEDISRGKAFLEETFNEKFYPVFTPPWNRCTEETFKVLDQLNYQALSKDQGEKPPLRGFNFKEISTTLDIFQWKGKAMLKEPAEITRTLISQMDNLNTLGILLHHKVMDRGSFSFLQSLIDILADYPIINFCSFEKLITCPEIKN